MSKAVRLLTVFALTVALSSAGVHAGTRMDGTGPDGTQKRAKRRAARKGKGRGAADKRAAATGPVKQTDTTEPLKPRVTTGRARRGIGSQPSASFGNLTAEGRIEREIVEHVISRFARFTEVDCERLRQMAQRLREESSLDTIKNDLMSRGLYSESSLQAILDDVDSDLTPERIHRLTAQTCGQGPVITGCPWPLNIIFRC